MTTLIFVHGTGVRRAGFDRIFEKIAAGVGGVDPSIMVAPCYWGEPFGARLSRDGASIPDGPVARGPGDEGDGDTEVERWALLELDPLFELRLIAASGGATEAVPHAIPAGQRIRQAAIALTKDLEVCASVLDAGLADTFDDAVTEVLAAEATGEAFVVGQHRELAVAAARAFVADALLRADEAAGVPVPLHGDQRDRLVALLIVKLHGDARSGPSRALLAGARLAMELGATRKVERKRMALTSRVSPLAGDIMLYLTRGAPISRYISQTITSINDDVVLLAHSLGGIACVDLLVTAPLANVRGLVTVGSQASYLHELGALPSLEPSASLPDTFPVPWMNVFDRRDLLAFLAEPIFGERVRDVELNNRAPFPRSHSAYFGNPALYAVVKHVVTAVRR
jgi:hypothetical protein